MLLLFLKTKTAFLDESLGKPYVVIQTGAIAVVFLVKWVHRFFAKLFYVNIGWAVFALKTAEGTNKNY